MDRDLNAPRLRPPWGTRRTAMVTVAAVAAGFALWFATSADANGDDGHRTDAPGVTANMFEWNWSSVARECTNHLGPAGFRGVQVAPPADSLKRTSLGNGSDTVLHPWWEVYQPVDYTLTSRMGTAAQFAAMVSTCRQAGVKVYVDAVINHMTGQGNTSYGGQSYTHFSYPAVPYTAADFHQKGTGPNDCSSSSGGIEDFNNVHQVFKCELLGLADLNTSDPGVQSRLAAYLNTLIGYGVSGFRVDAAKHIGQADLDAIYRQLHRTKDGLRPYWALEVFGGGPGILSPQAFTTSGSVLGLDGVKQIRDAFKSYPDQHIGSLATLQVFGSGSGLTPSDRTLSFVTNHDTERNGDALSYKDGSRYLLANEWLLASGYGSPQVFSGFTFSSPDDSPPSDANGIITDADCGTGRWTCTHRNPGIVGMVGWHNYVGKAQRANFYTDGDNVIAFSRGNRGWAAFNNGTSPKTITVQTGLPGGDYCNVLASQRSGSGCTNGAPPVHVDSHGLVTTTVGPSGAVGLDRANKL
ncbi:alpha-amylase [Phycicoccus badiiscoriae]|uniref:Alpha-amylase n=1 Tax=Pedococcus badiiscoriae TaxID=642776 RepID=A0A852WJ57_9MICO|nr:alpha-amylase family protein [Pedococcus badiiscoriae]NYG06305.1 alpha-amylase [Pedococcus badiiscoriae]